MAKAQVAVEFLMYTGAFMMAFMLVLIVFSSLGVSEIRTRNFFLLAEVGQRISTVVSGLVSVGDGACYVTSFPTTLNGCAYTTSLRYDGENSTGIIELGDGERTPYAFSLPSVNITSDDFDKNNDGIVEIPSGSQIVMNFNNGTVTVEKNAGEGCS